MLLSRYFHKIYTTYLSPIRTNERLRSRTAKIDVSTLATPERCLPTFKVALVICQEDYDRSQYFDPLKAPKNDGTSLVTALKEMDFQVFAFANITLEEMRNAVEMFASFIDGKTQDTFLFLPFPLSKRPKQRLGGLKWLHLSYSVFLNRRNVRPVLLQRTRHWLWERRLPGWKRHRS